MLTGPQTIAHLDSTLASLRGEAERANDELAELAKVLSENQLSQTSLLKRMAKVRLDEIEQGTVLGALENTDARVRQIMQERDGAQHLLVTSIAELQEKIEALESQRQPLHQTVNDRGQVVIDLEAKAQGELEADEAYLAQLQTTRAADAVAREATAKIEHADKDRIEKGKAFEADPLFMYLWKRGYGTTEYSGGHITRMLDGWVARLCNFSEYRPVYWTLLELPVRLAEHAQRSTEVADKELAELSRIEVAAAEKTGVTDAHTQLAAAEKELDAHDDLIAQAEDQMRVLQDSKAGFASGSDPHSLAAIREIAAALQNADAHHLQDAVRATVSVEDDNALHELQEAIDRSHDLGSELAEGKKRVEGRLARVRQLEEVRRKFKAHRYDTLRSGFTDPTLVISLFDQFMKGLVDGGSLWSTIQRHQRHRDVGAWPDFGTGGLGGTLGGGGRRRQRSTWHSPGGRRGGSFKLPRSGGFSSRGRGGGFKTGGGF